MSKEQLRKNKKRVVSTLFLYLLFFTTACDFKPPEDWIAPDWYIDLTIPLINNAFSFEELLNDTIFYSDTLAVALPFDTVNEVVHLTYPVILPPVALPNELFAKLKVGDVLDDEEHLPLLFSHRSRG